MTIDDKIKQLGNAFRGLWLSRSIDTRINMWSCTCVYEGDYVEPPHWFDTPHEALDYMIERIVK